MTQKKEAAALLQTSAKDLVPKRSSSVALQTSAKPAMSKALQRYIEIKGLRCRTDASDPALRREELRQARDAGVAAKVMQGYWLAEIHALEGADSFLSAAAELRIGQRAAYHAMDVFQIFCSLPDLEAISAIGQLDFSAALELKKWKPEEIAEFAYGRNVRGLTLDRAVDMTVREFAQATKEPELVTAQKKIHALQADKEGLESELKEAQGALKHRYESLKMPDFAAHVRQESIALAEQMTLAVAAFEDLMLERLGTDKEARQFPEWKDRAAGTGYHALRSVHARTQMLLEKIEESYGPEVTGKIEYEHTLSAGELAIARDALGVILKRHKAEADNREADRVNAKGGRGRPRGKKRVD